MQSIDRLLHDPREQDQVTHSQLSLLRQRVYGLCLGYEDLNDHQTLRVDLAIQTALDCEDVLASQATLCRLENRTDRQAMVDIHKVFFDQFVTSFKKPPKELIISAAPAR